MLSKRQTTSQVMEDLFQLTTLLATERNIDTLFNNIVEFACRLTGAEVGRIFILDKTKRFLYSAVSQNVLIPKEYQGLPPVELFIDGRRNIQDVLSYCAFTGKVLNIDDIYQYSGFDLQSYYDYDATNKYKTFSMLAAPFRNHLEETIGVLQLTNCSKKRGEVSELVSFPKEMESIIAAFASQAAVSLNNAQLIEQNAQLIHMMDDTNRKLSEENTQLRHQMSASRHFTEIIGTSKAMQQVFDLMGKVVNTTATVLIGGETGTGKELIAKSIHFNSPRKNAHFVAQNCAALPENLLEGELFGYKKGAFSGADQDKKGLIEHAHGGTLFLDEIGDMSVGLQAKLLRVLQEREIRPLGGLKDIPVDIRVIAATHKSLIDSVKKGEFREDLFYRLSVFPIDLPPLRERVDDIPALAAFFLDFYSKQHAKDVIRLSPAAIEQIMHYDFPGNIREMRNMLERAVLICEDHGTILPEHFPREVQQAQVKFDSQSLSLGEGGDLKSVVGRYEAFVIKRRLSEHAGNQTKTAKSLSISRRALIDKLNKHDIGRQTERSVQNSVPSVTSASIK